MYGGGSSQKIGMCPVPEAAKATLKARRRNVGESLLDLSTDIKRLCGEAYQTLSSASLEQASVDHLADAIGATLAKDVIRSKPSTLDKALSEALELETVEFRAVRMRERVVSEVSTYNKAAWQVQNPPLPGWAPELSSMIASVTAKAAAKAMVNAISSSGTRGNYVSPPPQFRLANSRGRGCFGHVGQCIISRGTPRRETSAGRGTGRKTESLPARRPSTSDTH